MSAGATILYNDEIHILSDGIMSYKDEAGNWQVQSRDINKIKPINERCALLWLGAGLVRIWEITKERIRSEGLSYPLEIAEAVADVMKSFYESHEINMNGNVRVAGFDSDDRAVIYKITSYDGFRPIRCQTDPGAVNTWCMIHGNNSHLFHPAFIRHGAKPGAAFNLKPVCWAAFREVVRQPNDKTVGGSLHYLGLRAGKPPEVMDEPDTDTVFYGADDKRGTAARAYLRTDGYLFSGSISDSLFLESINDAAAGTNQADAPNFAAATEWSAFASQTGPTGSPATETVVVRKIRFRKKPGATKLVLIFWAKQETTQQIGGGGTGGSTMEVRLKGNFITDASLEITSTSFTRHVVEAEFHPADLFNEVDRIAEIEIFAEANVSQGSASDFVQTGEVFLDKGLLQLEQSV